MAEFVLSTYARFEPASPSGDIDNGIAAPLADPAWMLGRQWQLGEHQGEDASSPIQVDFTVQLFPFVNAGGSDLVRTPMEALVEHTPNEWWTPSRRVRIGTEIAARAEATVEIRERIAAGDYLATDLPSPYDALNGRVLDGLRIFVEREALGIPADWFAAGPVAAPDTEPDAWDAARFEHNAEFAAGGLRFQISSHDGGRIDWYSSDAERGAASSAGIRETGNVLTTRLSYAGAPAPRWWQLENRQLDFGGVSPDRSHFASLLVLEAVSSHSDDWFVAPIDTTTPALGHLLSVTRLRVRDSFDEQHELRPPESDWSLFQVDGLVDPWSLPIVPTTVMPLSSAPMDQVDINLDEDANLLWAMERRVGGRETADPHAADEPELRANMLTSSERAAPLRYDPSELPQPHWHPYVFENAVRISAVGFTPPSPAELALEDEFTVSFRLASGARTNWSISARVAGRYELIAQFVAAATTGTQMTQSLRLPSRGERYDLIQLLAHTADRLEPALLEEFAVDYRLRAAIELDMPRYRPPAGSTLQVGDTVSITVKHAIMGELEWELTGMTAAGRSHSLGWYRPAPPLDRKFSRELPTLAAGERWTELLVRVRNVADARELLRQQFPMDHRYEVPELATISDLLITPRSPARLPAQTRVTVRFRYVAIDEARWIVQGWGDDNVGRSLGNFVLPATAAPVEVTRELPGLQAGQQYVNLIIRAWTPDGVVLNSAYPLDITFF